MSKRNLQLIRKFMKRSLNKEEHLLFEEQMQGDDFANQVAEETVRLSSRSKLQSELKAIHQEMVASPPIWRQKMFIGLLILVLALLAGLFYHFNQKMVQTSPTLAFSTYFEPYPNLFEQRTTQLADPQKIQEALAAYDEEAYG